MKMLSNLQSGMRRLSTTMVSITAGVMTSLGVIPNALAVLPTATNPGSGTATDGNIIQYIQFTTQDALLVGGLFVVGIAFIGVAWFVFTKFQDARKGRAEWAEVILTTLIGAGILVFMVFVVTQGSEVIA